MPRALQFSHWMLESELKQLQSFGFLLPLIFLLVAAFTLNVALTRVLALPAAADRGAQGARLRATPRIGWHYVKWALVIGVAGVALGWRSGAWLGSAIGGLYNQFFRFPALLFSVPPGVVVGAALLTWVSPAPGR